MRPPTRHRGRSARHARGAVFLVGALTACQSGQLQPPALGDSSVRPPPTDASVMRPQHVADASPPPLDATPRDSAPPDASTPDVVSSDAETARDAEVHRDFCGNVLPTAPSASGVLDGSAMFLPAMAPQAAVKVRGPAFSASFDEHVLWVFDATYAQDNPASVLATSSFTLSNFDHPFVLAEANDSMPPATFLPELEADRAQAGSDGQLTYELGNPLLLPLGGALLFYSVSARLGDSTVRPLGTRVARLRAGMPIMAEPEPTLLFAGTAPAFRTSVVVNDGHAYVYGCASNDTTGYDCKLARVAFGSFAEPNAYQYRTIGGWSNDVTASTVVVANLSSTLSVSYNAYLDGFLLTSFVPMTNRITLQSAARPEGPWTELGQVTVPMLADAHGNSLPAYAIEHAELASNCGKNLVLTYLTPTASDQRELRPILVELR